MPNANLIVGNDGNNALDGSASDDLIYGFDPKKHKLRQLDRSAPIGQRFPRAGFRRGRARRRRWRYIDAVTTAPLRYADGARQRVLRMLVFSGRATDRRLSGRCRLFPRGVFGRVQERGEHGPRLGKHQELEAK
jgi:hypothetical protein